jgi:hydrogenase nickel incorporation protein HypA/HybF
MHETGIAAEILNIAEREAARRGAAAVASVTVRVGDLSGVAPEALAFAFEALCEGTAAAGARLTIERVAVRALCPACGLESMPETDLVLWCAGCGAVLEVVAGQELQVESLEIREH